MNMKKDIEQLINKFDLAITIQLNKTDLNYAQIENKKKWITRKIIFHFDYVRYGRNKNKK